MIQTNSTANMLLLGLTNQMKIRHQDKKKGVRVPKLASQTYNMKEEDAMERIKSKENKKVEDARKKEANKKEREEKKKEVQKNKELASETRKKDMEIRRKDREEAMKNKPKRQYKKRKVEIFQEEVGVVQEEVGVVQEEVGVVQENGENGVKCKKCGISLFNSVNMKSWRTCYKCDNWFCGNCLKNNRSQEEEEEDFKCC
jgi:hypothetical protein